MTTAPSVLLRYQQEAIALSEQHEFLMIEKSRRTGVTYAFAAKAVLDAAPAEGAVNTFYIAYNKDMTREFVGYCGMFASAFDKAAAGAPNEFLFDDGSEKGILALRVDFPSGKSIVALSSKPRSLRGMQGNVIIDEAAYHDDLEGVHKAAMALTMWGGHVVAISTHSGADNPFATMIDDIRSKKLEGHVQRITLQDALDDGLYRRICLVSGKPWSQEAQDQWEASLRKRYGEGSGEELDVIPAKGSGVYLPRATIEACMSPDYKVARLALKADFDTQTRQWREAYIDDWLRDVLKPLVATFDPYRRSFWGQDFARSSDLSTIAAGQIDPSTVLHNRLGIEMQNVPFWAQFRILCWLCRNLPMWSTGKMDARGNGQQLAEDMQEEFGAERIEAVMATQAIYLARMPRMKARFDDRTILVPQDDGIVDDLRMIKLVRGIPMIVDRIAANEDGAKGKRHGDYSIALMNLVGAADEDVQPIDLAVLGRMRADAGHFIATTRGFGTIARREDFGGRNSW